MASLVRKFKRRAFRQLMEAGGYKVTGKVKGKHAKRQAVGPMSEVMRNVSKELEKSKD